jgi:hypothetical protein
MKKMLPNLKLFVVTIVIMLPMALVGALIGKLTPFSWAREAGILIGTIIGSFIVSWLLKNKKI